MKIKHVIEGDPLLSISRERYYPENFVIDDVIPFNEIIDYIENKALAGSIQEIYFEGVLIKYFNFKLFQSVHFEYKTNMEAVGMHFALDGHLLLKEFVLDTPLLYDENKQSIIYRNGTEGEVNMEAENINFLNIYLTPQFFMKYLPTEIKKFSSFGRDIYHEDSCILGDDVYKINGKTNSIINDIIKCNFSGHFKKMFLKSKIIELLLVQFQQQMKFEKKIYTLKEDNVSKMYDIKDYLIENLYENLSLSQIAKTFGTNINILKTGFKEVFDTSVFKFIHDEKMKIARHIIETRDISISEVAYMMGYNQPQNFTAAFKRKYGILPRRIKKE
ncbi:AraC family transcriptional regulator [Elizabethkingia anophelis]|uniref:helix-turn-helix domain-containing protein n=1 Tax=Elizabethkingia anophelis TaxID=1117645 RepID=UPI000994C68A|nr:AraC family transcriptional regulator [Elizabethkingia anophelis]AQW94702.1 hypothetical protein BBD30_11150 [Elizabethkingia anophelis]MCL1691981.1 AraC family transcriptional regulator [Elizabethkingia anophelis]MDV3509058.1 AraC family transcriptional regulator [Elizabethkingia anophelis]MDV3544287.1 AraC family transcriptional regulator [Elizabethkingia anophelis]MDV3954196.1 AraC family transcriptional regulator [Elizabethkingia anophelis]